MGIAFHPDFATSPFVYAMHTYGGFLSAHNKLVRMRWNGTALGAPETLLDGFPGSGIHNGSRIAVGPDRMLYVTTGDAGDGDVAQDLHSFGGKILRLTLDGRPAPGNPFDNAVWSYGHRNPQGLVFHPTTGVLYETEHGPSDNDEVNIIRRGGNYGWPNGARLLRRRHRRRARILSRARRRRAARGVDADDRHHRRGLLSVGPHRGMEGKSPRDVTQGGDAVSIHALARRHARSSRASRCSRRASAGCATCWSRRTATSTWRRAIATAAARRAATTTGSFGCRRTHIDSLFAALSAATL